MLAVRIQSRAREALWRIRPNRIEPLPLSWTLEPGMLDRTRLVWPIAYDWPGAHRWVGSLIRGLQTHVDVQFTELPQPYRHVVVFQLEFDGNRHDVAIDYADRSELNDACRRRIALYFKMQFASHGYDDESVVPGGFPPGSPDIYDYLGRLRRIRSRQRFSTDVYGRFSTTWAVETRRQALRLLREQRAFSYKGGHEVLRYSRYLTEIARAKVCIDLPGHGDFCFRLIDYLAVGSCIIGPRPSTRLHAPLEHGVNIIYCADDLSDLAALCERYVMRHDERERVANAARAHFDTYLERTQWAAYYLQTAICRLG